MGEVGGLDVEARVEVISVEGEGRAVVQAGGGEPGVMSDHGDGIDLDYLCSTGLQASVDVGAVEGEGENVAL